jgi:FlgD Ig-like domain
MRPLYATIIAGLCLCFLIGTADAWYPTTVLEEMGTSTTCVYCPLSYAGIELCKEWFDENEFNAIHYYDPPLLTHPDAQARINYYNMVGYPNLYFQGQSHMVGTDDHTSSGIPYKSRVQEHLIDPSYFKMTMNVADFDLGVVDFDIEVMEDGPVITDMVVQIAVVENGLSEVGHEFDDVVRDMLTETPVTVSTLGQIQNVNQVFTVDPTWVVENLRIVAFIQDNATKAIETSVSSLAKPEYAARFYATGDRMAVTPLYNSNPFHNFVIYNAGTQTDIFTAEILITGGDPTWSVNLCDEAICYGLTYSEELAPGEHLELHTDIVPFTEGWVQTEVRIYQANGEPGKYGVIDYGTVTTNIEVLYVDDDGFDFHEDQYVAALDHCGENYGLWNRRQSPITISPDFPYFGPGTIIWGTGMNDLPLTQEDRDFLTAFQLVEGDLMISGQNVAEQMDDLGGAAYSWYQNTLHASFTNDDSDVFTLEGVLGDPVTTQLSVAISGGDGADNQNSPDVIEPYGASATTIWNYSGVMAGGIRADTGIIRVVNMSFGFEAIDSELYRYMVMFDALKWLKTGDMAVDQPTLTATSLTAPSLFSGRGAIRFTLAEATNARLSVFGPDGRLVNTLVDADMNAGAYTQAWNGTDTNGNVAPAGVYYYRLQTATDELVRKAVLVR